MQGFVRTDLVASRAPPAAIGGPLGWLRRNLFSSLGNSLTTLAILGILAWALPIALRFLVVDAVWTGASGDACRPEVA
ncbi:amino acid ABC transporter permease, partial [Methylobacterium sp. W2]|nr:amino acid ABC transporter permease [Methylobacterium sp. W2]